MTHDNLPVDLIIISDRFENRKKLKYHKMFYIDSQGYVAASVDDSSYNLFKIVEMAEGKSELHDIADQTEWDTANNHLLTYYPEAVK
jgi:hypothetical protein